MVTNLIVLLLLCGLGWVGLGSTWGRREWCDASVLWIGWFGWQCECEGKGCEGEEELHGECSRRFRWVGDQSWSDGEGDNRLSLYAAVGEIKINELF